MKPCPQCKGTSVYVLRGYYGELKTGKGMKHGRFAVCFHCGYYGPWKRTEGMAIKAWDKITRKAK